MNTFTKTTLLAAVMAVTASLVHAFTIQPLGVEGRSQYGATHIVRGDYTDLTTSTTNTAQTLTLDIAAKEGYSLVAFMLDEAFDTGNTNYSGSLALTVGDNASVATFLSSTEMASDGTEIWLKYGTGSNVAYSATNSLKFIFTPNAQEAVDDNTAGAYRVYLKKLSNQ